MTRLPASKARSLAGALVACVLLGSSALTPGCYTSQIGLLRSGLDSLRAEVDTMTVRDSVTASVVADVRQELGAQRDLLLSAQARSASTQRELADLMARLDSRLDEVTTRFTRVNERSGGAIQRLPVTASPPADAGAAPPAAATPPTPSQTFDLATRDLTEGRYPLALQGYRDFLRRYPDTELADNAQFGVGECFFAQAAFDSAATEYAKVDAQWPKGDRAPAALYKLGLCQERLGRGAESKKTFEDLVRRFPSSSEAGLARDRIGAAKH